jgi:predicted dehydrogenase
MTADRVRVAVIGTGHWAQAAHIPGWQRDPRADVVALADVNETALADAASSFGVTRVTTDYRELLDDPGIDVIDVATGNRPHFQIPAPATGMAAP